MKYNSLKIVRELWISKKTNYKNVGFFFTNKSSVLFIISSLNYYQNQCHCFHSCSNGLYNSNNLNHEYKFDWPKSRIPTPYEILGTSHMDIINIDKNILKNRFLSLVKLYHPDLKNSKKLGISEKECTSRFRLVTSAYKILISNEKRKSYDLTGEGWPKIYHRPNYSNLNKYPNYQIYKYRYNNNNNNRNPNEERNWWSSATWEDYQKYNPEFHRRNKKASDEAKKQMDDYKWFVLAGILSFVCAFTYLQSFNINALYTNSVVQRDRKSLDALHDLQMAYNNYHWGESRESRKQRFLIMRDSALSTPKPVDQTDLVVPK